MSHLAKIVAAGFDVHVFDAESLVTSLDGSGDLPKCVGMSYFDTLLIDKYQEMDPMLIDDLNMMGIENPILIEIEGDQWIMVDGHHRLAWAVMESQPVPVVFIEWDTDIFALDKIMCQREVFYNHN